MTKEQANALVSRIELLHGKNYQNQHRDFIIRDILKEPVEVCGKVVGFLENANGYLPTPSGLIKIIRDNSAQIREQIAIQERKKNQNKETVFDKEQNSDHAKKACLLIRGIMGGIGREKTIDGMMHMENLFPNKGWSEETSKLKIFYSSYDQRKRVQKKQKEEDAA